MEVLLFVQGPARDSLVEAKSDIGVKVIYFFLFEGLLCSVVLQLLNMQLYRSFYLCFDRLG